MLSSLRTLAAAADVLHDAGKANLVETPTALTLSALSAESTTTLVPLLDQIGWAFQLVDAAGEHAEASTLTDDFGPFIATLYKEPKHGFLRVLTLNGLSAFLHAERRDEVWESATLTTAFSTMASSFQPWGGAEIFTPSIETKSPRELIREYGAPIRAPQDIRTWLLRANVTEELWGDKTFRIFARDSTQALMRALASEVTNDGSLIFAGPPRLKVDAPDESSFQDLGINGFNHLRTATAWVYESSLEAERRHALFSSEFGRSSPPRSAAGAAFAIALEGAWDGARLSYQLSLSEVSREAIKAQGDLRKAVADDTAKLADNSRQVAAATAAAIATGVALLAAKLGTDTPAWVLVSVASIAGVYVAAIVVSGWIYMAMQEATRKEWRKRLYSFIPEQDYKAMVTSPAKDAERMFKVMAVGGAIVSVIALVVVFLV